MTVLWSYRSGEGVVFLYYESVLYLSRLYEVNYVGEWMLLQLSSLEKGVVIV